MSNLDAVKALQAKQDEAAREAAIEAAIAKYSAQNSTQDDKQAEHDELVSMCNEVSMLELARRDTGEQGTASGEYVAFRDCPLCGHKNCFRVYPGTNTCTCFSGSNPDTKAGKMGAGGSVLDYLQQRHGGDITAAVRELRELTGHPFKPKHKATRDAQGMPDGLLLPPWEPVRASDPPKRNPPLIPGILRCGHVAVLAGKGKVGKSWSAIQLAVAVATGGKWFGMQIEHGGRVLYIDPELDPKSLDNRFELVCREMGVDKAVVDSSVVRWSLRGVPETTINNIEHDIRIRCAPGDFALIIIDSASAFVEGDENSSVDVSRFLRGSVLRIAAVTGAAVLVVHHFGKAKDGDRDASDRARGSSVWLDAPDAALTLTEVFPPSGEPSDYLDDGAYAVALESGGIREFARMEPINLIFKWPIHMRDFEGVTDSWKPRSSTRDGGKATSAINKEKARANAAAIVSKLLGHFYSEGIGGDGLILKEAAEVCGCDARTLEAAIERSGYFCIEQVSARKRYVVPASPPRAAPEAAEQLEIPN